MEESATRSTSARQPFSKALEFLFCETRGCMAAGAPGRRSQQASMQWSEHALGAWRSLQVSRFPPIILLGLTGCASRDYSPGGHEARSANYA